MNRCMYNHYPNSMSASCGRPMQRPAQNNSCGCEQEARPLSRPMPDEHECRQETKRPSRSALLNKINEVSFAVVDISLYLDTHPCDREAMAFYRENVKKRDKLLREYARHFGPLTIDTADESQSENWEWVMQPWPWEGGNC